MMVTEARTVEEDPESVAVTSNSNVVSVVTAGAAKVAEGPLGTLLSDHFTAGLIALQSPPEFLTSSAVVQSCFHAYAAPSPLPSVVNKTVEATRLP